MKTLNLNDFLVIICTLFILYFLKLILNNQEKIIKKLNDKKEKAEKLSENTCTSNVKKAKGTSEGELEITEDINEEVLAVIMSSVSAYSKIPLNSLKIKSIRKIEG